MDEALSTVPAGLRPPAPVRMVRPAVGRFRPRPVVWLSLALWLGWSGWLSAGEASPTVSSSEAYLPSLGPTLLRFARVPSTHFAWPAAAKVFPPAQTNPASATEVSGPPTASPRPNDLLAQPTLEQFLAPTEHPPAVATEIEYSAASAPSLPSELIGRPLSASELLAVTPQMLAEYLKNPAGGTNLPPATPLPGDELYFHPPVVVPLPSSAASYRIQ